MEHLKKPIWLGFSLLLPLVLLILLFSETYDIIESLLTESQKGLWSFFAYYLLATIGFGSIYIAQLIIKKENISAKIAWGTLLLSIINITCYFYFNNELLPSNIPNWMFTSKDLEVFPFSFMIPGALYAIILLVIHYSPDPKSQKTYINLVPIIGIPLAIFLFGVIFTFLFSGRWSGFFLFTYLPLSLLVFANCAFIFFLIRFIYILSSKSKRRDTLLTIIKILFTCIFPLAGLYFNNAIDHSSGGIFGNFQHPIYFILSLLNGIVLCLPTPTRLFLRWILFIVKSILFTFILYFFTIFIPFLPLSIIAILLVGFGFLMLAPVIVFVYQITSIRADLIYLKTKSNKLFVNLILMSSLLTIPAAITVDYQLDRKELDSIFDFLYERAYDDNVVYSFHSNRIENLLTHIREVKSTRINHRPFLDSYYNWIVLDNLMLSEEKLNQISNVLRGEKLDQKLPLSDWFRFPEQRSTLNTITVESQYNDAHWTSTLVLEIKNEHNFDNEFRLYFETQDDCFISNYYLEIEGKKEYGILSEKRTAAWVYNNIVKTRRDPGILTFMGKNKYLLKVFPVQKKEMRYTGIEFTHKEPINIRLNDTTITLGDSAYENKEVYEILNGNGLFIPRLAKEQLSEIQRKRAYHILIDQSKGVVNERELTDIAISLSDSLPNPSEINYWAVNYNYTSLTEERIKEELASVQNKGGFYPEYLMKRIIHNSYTDEEKSCPIFIMVTPESSNVSILNGFSELLFTLPDIPYYYVAESTDELIRFNLESGKRIGNTAVSAIQLQPVLSYYWKGKDYIVPQNSSASYIVDSVEFVANNKWQEGVLLEQQLNQYALHPHESNRWLSIIKASISANILSPYTAFLSLENEAQKKALLHKQEEVLKSDLNLDLEETTPMSEPHVFWYLLILLGFYFKKRMNR